METIIKTISKNASSVDIVYDDITYDCTCKLFVDGHRILAEDYIADDKQDAIVTAYQMLDKNLN